MSRSIRRTLVLLAAVTVALTAAACGTQSISVPKSETQNYAAAEIFHERCGGCHTLAVAAANGSGDNPRTYLDISGPNFNVRCERPVDRVLYAIENGGFGGAYMPQNIVVGQQAREVAEFVSKFAGRDAPIQPDSTPCADQKIGTLPPLPTSAAEAEDDSSTSTATETTTNPNNAGGKGKVVAGANPSAGGGT